ncbi:START domain containing protein [Yasminevirus sp. GU-2018]|uniref:START domain containing protein n=1 Tax=Yasminevirus sp. GU-2018 TaxID=2420051 RepID=A0A5K0UCD1_9VIRU|nr:START domain containing protein [Yasminevirus sp. GU-2018]
MATTGREQEYLTKAESVLESAQKLYDRNDWTHVLTKEGTELKSLNLPDICPIPAYMVTATYPVSKEKIISKVWGVSSEAMAKANDPKLTMWAEVERGANWKVLSQYNSMMWPIWPRHTVFAQVRVEKKDKTYLVGFSVNNPKVENTSKTHVTSFVHMSVYEYSSNVDGSTTVRRITLIDPRGAIPVSLVTMYSGNLVNVFNTWRQ